MIIFSRQTSEKNISSASINTLPLVYVIFNDVTSIHLMCAIYT